MKRKGFTLVEFAVVIVLMGIMAAFITINPLVASQTAQKEAERIAFFLNNTMRKADIRRHEFAINFPKSTITEPTELYDIVQSFYIAWRCSDSETGDNIIKAEDGGKKYKREENPFTITSSCRLRAPIKNVEYSNFTYTNVDEGISLNVTDSQNKTYQVLINKYGMVDTKE